MISASRSASSPASASWSRTPSSRRAGGRRGGQGVGLRPARWRAPRGPARRRCAASSAKPEPGLLGRERGVLARLRRDRLDLAEPEPQQVGLAGALASGGHHLVQLALGGEQALVQAGVVGQQRGDLVAAEPVERLALGARPGAGGAGRTGRAPRPGARRPRPARTPGTDAPPTNARERPSAETLRASTTRSSSTSPPASSTARGEPGEPAGADHALDPGGPGAGADGTAVGPAAEQQARAR